MIFVELFFRFAFVGLFSIGGGLATLPFLQALGETTQWFTSADISNMVAVSESTPGPLGINMATYIGYQVGDHLGIAGGILGSVTATMGLVFPALIIIILVSKILQKFKESKYVEFAFYGLRAASLGLISAACLSVAEIAFFNTELFEKTGNFLSAFDYKAIILSVIIFFLIQKFKKLHPIVLIISAAAAGIIFNM